MNEIVWSVFRRWHGLEIEVFFDIGAFDNGSLDGVSLVRFENNLKEETFSLETAYLPTNSAISSLVELFPSISSNDEFRTFTISQEDHVRAMLLSEEKELSFPEYSYLMQSASRYYSGLANLPKKFVECVQVAALVCGYEK